MSNVELLAKSARQDIGEFFVGVMSAGSILKITQFDFRRMAYAGGYIALLGIQRRVDPSRVKKIAKYARTVDSCFPTSLVISVDERCVSITREQKTNEHILEFHEYIDDDSSELNIPLNEAGSIIDGQHRLKGIQEANREDILLPVTVFVGIDEATEASIFSIVNLAQTKVNKSLVYDLFSLQERRSAERTCHEVVVALDKMEESPFRNMIKRLGTATLDRKGETLTQATIVKGLLPYVTSDALADRDRGKRFGFWEPVRGAENHRRIFRHFFVRDEDEKIIAVMLNYFTAISKRWPKAWQGTGEGNIIRRTNGYLAFMRFLKPAYLYLTTTNEVPDQAQFTSIFDRVALHDEDFNTANFPPGSSGAKKLYERLLADASVAS